MRLVIQTVLASVALLAGPSSHLLEQCPDRSHDSWGAAPCFIRSPPRDRRAFRSSVLAEILQCGVVSRRNPCNPRGVKRKMSNFPIRPRHTTPLLAMNIKKAIGIILGITCPASRA